MSDSAPPEISRISQSSGSEVSYLKQLAERRENDRLEMLVNFGLALGWIFFLVGGFCWFCVVSSVDPLWLLMTLAGLTMLFMAVLIPEALAPLHKWWMKLAHLQGRFVMMVLLTTVYYVLIVPCGWILRRRYGSAPFYEWDNSPPAEICHTGWERLRSNSSQNIEAHLVGTTRKTNRRSLINMLVMTISFFIHRGHVLTLPILLILLSIGLLLFFVQGSVLAPFIYTLF